MQVTRHIKSTAQWILVVTSFLLVIWAFARVATRSWSKVDTEGMVTITVMHWSGGGGQQEDAIVEDSIRAFMEDHPNIKVTRINPGDTGQYFTKLQTMMAAGQPPDLFYMDYGRIPKFVSEHQLQPLSDLVDSDPEIVLEDFFPATIEAFRWDGTRAGQGELYGIPKDFTTVGFYWNKNLFTQAGATFPTPDWTWEDFARAARLIGALDKTTGAEFVTWPFILRGYLWTEGVDIVKDGDWSELQLGDPTVVAALERLRNWRFEEEHTLARAQAEGVDPASLFFTGKIGMVGPFGRWVVPSFRTIETFDWDFAPLPQGAAHANVIATVGWSMASKSNHQEETWELLKWLTGEESQSQQSKLGLAIPTRIDIAYSDSFFDEQLPESDGAYLDAAKVAKVPFWPVDTAFGDRFSNYMDLALRTGEPVSNSIEGFTNWWSRRQIANIPRAIDVPTPWRSIQIFIGACIAILLLVIYIKRKAKKLSPTALAGERAGYTMISPWFAGFLFFMAIPILISFVLALSKWSGLGPLDTARYVGFDNFKQLFLYDSTFKTSLLVTLFYAAIAVPGSQVIALLGAVLLNASVRGINFFRAMWYLPSVLAGVGIAVLWQWVFRSDGGLMNLMLAPILELFGLTPPEWFNADAKMFGPPAFALMSFWVTGGSMMIYLAGLRNIPKTLYEAADIDGAGGLRRFLWITLPMLSPVLLFNLIMAVIGSFQVFTQAFVMTGGGPGDSTRFYVLYLYNLAFDNYEMGYASAMAWVLLLIVLGLTVVILRSSSKYVYYEGMKS